MIKMLDSLMKQLESELDMSFSSNTTGKYRVPVNEDLTAEIFAQQEAIYFTCTFTKTPKQNEELLFERLLNASLFGHLTKEAVIGLNENQQLVITRAVENSVAYKEFKDTLEDFLNITEYWSTEAANFEKSGV
jgi:Tir chaperone protein (CesT) family